MTISPQEFWRSFKRLLSRKESGHQEYREEKPKQIPSTGSGVASQPIRRKLEKVYLQVGLDFGTSSTKVMFSQIGRRGTRVISFNHDLPNYPSYCLPSLAAIDDRGQLLLGTEAAKWLLNKGWDYGLQRFKVIVAGELNNDFRDFATENNYKKYCIDHNCSDVLKPDRVTAIYLAYVMIEARKMIESYQEYKDVELDIAFNICMPIDYIERNSVKVAFEKTFSWAEAIENAWRINRHDFDILKISYDTKNNECIMDRRVFAVPEAVASIASYLVSLRKREGLHALIDFGAGTTDVSICNLFVPYEESKSYWYSARNIPQGTVMIERIIASHIKSCHDNSFCTYSDVNDYLNNLNDSRFIDADSTRIKSKIYNILQALKNSGDYYKTWGLAYRHLTKETAWEKVEVFVCGGGAKLPYIEKVFSEPWWEKINACYPVSRLPIPNDYDDNGSAAPFERMTVAYGLTRPIPELETYVLPSEAPDHTPPIIRAKERDRDDLYPK